MNIVLFFSFLVVLSIITLIIGKKSSKGLKSNDDYFLSGRKLGLWSVTITIVATNLGGGTLIGAADAAYSKGWLVILYPLGTCLGLVLLSLGFGAKVRKKGLKTVAELFEKVYQSPLLRQCAAMLSIASLFCILITQGIATRKFLVALGFDQKLLFFGFWTIVVVYTVMGGLKAVVKTDIIQAIFIITALGTVFFMTTFNDTPVIAETIPLSGEIPWMGWLLMPLAFMFIEQDMGQRCLAAKKPQTVSRAALIAAIITMVTTIVPIYLGNKARLMGLNIDSGNSVLMTTIQALTSPSIAAFFSCAILMAIISTADSLICSISSNLVYDFPLFKKKSIRWAQLLTCIIGMSSLAISFYCDDVVSVMILSYELSVSILFVPIVMAILSRGATKQAAYVSMIAGGLSFVLFRIYPSPIPRELCTLILSACGFITGQLFTMLPTPIKESRR